MLSIGAIQPQRLGKEKIAKMHEEDRKRFGAIQTTLKDSREVVIRPLDAGDAAALADFYESIPREDYRFYCPHPLTRQEAAEQAAGATDPRFACLVAEDRGHIAGHAWYRLETLDAPRAVCGLCVRRGYQGAGLGRALMERLLEIAREVGPSVIVLTAQAANTPAVALYQGLGFEVVDERMRGAFEEFAAEPEYVMEINLR